FYNARNYQFAWFYSRGLTEQALAFWNRHNFESYSGDSSLKDKVFQKKMDDMLADSNLSIHGSDRSMIRAELLLTEHFIRHTLETYEKGYVKRKEMEHFIPIKKGRPLELADSLLNKKHKDNKYFEDVNSSYK